MASSISLIVQAFNGSANSLQHILKPVRGAHPPFHLPSEANVFFPETDGAFRVLTLQQAQRLCEFYDISPLVAGVFEIDTLRALIATHIGYRQ